MNDRFDIWLRHFGYNDEFFWCVKVNGYNFSKKLLKKHIKKAGLFYLIGPKLEICMKPGDYLHNQHVLYVSIRTEGKCLYSSEFTSHDLKISFNDHWKKP